MRVTAFHLIQKIEEAAASYFSNSMIFSSQDVETERFVNFRRQSAALSFYLERRKGGEKERIDMGSLAVETIQERDEKIAFQCRMNILPSGQEKEFFVLLPTDREAYAEYMNFIDRMKVYWERNAQHYLPEMDEEEQAAFTAKTSNTGGGSNSGYAFMQDDEYEGLTPEEIEAVTGVRPGAKEPPKTAGDNLSMDEIAALTGGLFGAPEDASGGGGLSQAEIEALSAQHSEEAETETETISEDQIAAMLGSLGLDEDDDDGSSAPDKGPERANDEPLEMSADDILSQLNLVDEPKEEVEKLAKAKKATPKAAPAKDEPLEMSAEDIFAQMLGGGGPQPEEEPEEAPKAKPANDEPADMSAEDVLAQLMGTGAPQEQEAPPKAKQAKPVAPADSDIQKEGAAEPIEMSAEDIWKQISGG
jgi:hypothetical protein